MISVCVATYQGSQYIEEQLKSILDQLSPNDEIVISDDGSTDNTVAVVDMINDDRIKWVGVGGNLGVVRNFERAIAGAKGDVIFLSDQDDVWLSGKVQACLDALQSKLLVVTDCKIVDENLQETAHSFFELRGSGSGVLRNILVNSYLGCCMAFRRELLDYALPIPSNVPMHDMWIGLVAEMKGRVVFLPEPCLLYRRHLHNVTPMVGNSKFSIYKRVKYRIILIYLLAKRLLSLTFLNTTKF